jgi:ribonuclease HI
MYNLYDNLMKQIIIFTDGAVPNNQTKGNRKGGVGVFFGDNDSRNISLGLKETTSTKVTNQVCELLACIMAIEKIITTQEIINKKIIIYTDSMYIVNTITLWGQNWAKNDWKKADNKPIQNEDLVKKLYYLSKNINVNYQHVKAHTKTPDKNSEKYFEWYGNYMADKLAVQATK